MAGQVTGNIGNENVTLRNMATEDTLDAILQALQTKTISDTGQDGLRKKTGKLGEAMSGAAAVVTKGATSFTNFFSNFGAGTIRIVRDLDSNINNASFSFSTMSRGTGAFSEVLRQTAISVNQLQEQFNTYSKLMQVGGAVSGDFETLREQATGLGTDLVGLQRITEQYGFSLKIGSSTVAGGLKNLNKAFKAITDDGQLVAEWGRLGVLPQQITEQMLLAAEAQGGVGDVLKSFGGDAGKFGKGMLKSTQELNIFATAIGSNSKIMQEESAKAQQKITNRLLMSRLSEGEKKAVTYLQAFTGSAEEAMQVMRSYKSGFTSQAAGLFQSTRGIMGMGSEMDDFIRSISKGSAPLEALKDSGLLQYAKSLNPEQLKNMEVSAAAMEQTNGALAAKMFQQLAFIKGIKDTDPSKLQDVVNDLTGAMDPKNAKGVDTFALLQNEQVKLASATAALNTQFNRLGLAIATGALAGSNQGIKALGQGNTFIKSYLQDVLKNAGLKIEIPDDILKSSNDKIAEWLQSVLMTVGKQSEEQNNNTNSKISQSNAIDPNTTLVAKNADGRATTYSVQELINNEKLRKSTEAFKGDNNQVGTLVTASMLQKKIPTLGMVNAGDDADPIHSASGKHPKGLALDFAVKDDGRDKRVVYEETVNAMKQVLMKDLGLKEKDFTVMNKLGADGGNHIHFQFNDPAAADKVRELYQNQMKLPVAENKEVDPNASAKKEAISAAPYGTNTSVVASTVNSIPTVNISKPDWFDQSMSEYASNANKMASTLGAKFDSLTQIIKTKLG